MASDLLTTITEMLPPEMQAQLKNEQFRNEIQKTLAQFQMQDDAINATGELLFAPDAGVGQFDISSAEQFVSEDIDEKKRKRAQEKERQRLEAEAGARSAQSKAEGLTSGSAQKRGLRGMRSGF